MSPIAFYHSLLSRLFGEEPEETEETPPEQVIQPEPEPPPPSRELQLSQDHPLVRLWDFHVQETGFLPQPALSLDECPDFPALLSEKDIRRELVRLQMTVNSSANERLRQLKPKKGASGEEEIPDLDAKVVFYTAANNLLAWLMVYPPSGLGEELNRELLDQALDQAGIRFGVDDALLSSLSKNPERYFHLFLCARGKPAVHGEDGKVIDMFPRVIERKLTVDELNRVDYTSLNVIHNVNEGETICKLTPPTEGEEGRTVQDEPIPARDGKKAVLPKGRHTEISEDGERLVASSSGHVEFSGRAFQVKPLLNIPGNVAYSPGDINFLGDVC
ncbi:MAG: FapA family protein, partial [Oscillospiraceae bacterium]|nr:FapA family protein [Oscillospiraceae bacterium]